MYMDISKLWILH